MQHRESADNPGYQNRPQDPSPPPPADLADRHLSGAEATVRRAVREFLPPSDPDHDDMVQLALIGANRYLDDIGSFNGHPGSGFKRLAAAIARNRCRDLLRRRKTRGEVDLEPVESILSAPCPTVLDELEQTEQFELLARSVAELPRRCRRLLESRYLEGLDLQDLLAEFGFNSPQAFYYHRNQCLSELKTILNRWLG